MIKVGLIGEDPNDASSIKNLLSRRYPGKIKWKQLVSQITGDQMENVGFKRKLKKASESSGCDFYIYIRDLDALPGTQHKLKERKNWFQSLNKEIGNGIFLLNIYELEALLLADIETINRKYKSKIQFTGNPMLHKDPKEFLMHKTRKNQNDKNGYKESHAPELFKQLNIENVIARVSYFKEFIVDFEKRIA